MAVELSKRTGRPVRLSRPPRRAAGRRLPAAARTRRCGSAPAATARSPPSTRRPWSSSAWPAGAPVTTPAMTLYRCANARGIEANLRLDLRRGNAFRAPGRDGGHHGARAGDGRAGDRARASIRSTCAGATSPTATSRPTCRTPRTRCSTATTAWPSWRAGRTATGCATPQPDGLLRGMGCATQIWWGGGGPPSHATCRIGGDGVARVTIGVQDIGTGTLTAAADGGRRGARPAARARARASAATPARTSTAPWRAARRRRRR